MKRTTRVIAGITMLALAVVATGCGTRVVTTSPDGMPAYTVTASGEGVVSAPPDEAVMSFGVSRSHADAAKALANASAAAEKIGDALKKQGVKDEDIQTSNVSVYPRYGRAGGRSVIKDFQASIDVTARVDDLEKLGETITALSKAGAENVSGPSFTIAEDAPYRAEAIKKAVDDARAQAKEMAEAAGKQLGDVVSITSSSVSVPRYRHPAYSMELDVAAGSVPIETGQLDVSANMTVVFELK